jgi:hypothetical protein
VARRLLARDGDAQAKLLDGTLRFCRLFFTLGGEK